MMTLYNKQRECCGCELCSNVCPTSIIKMRQDKEGFFYPVIIDNEKCLDCKKCYKVCPEKNRFIKPRNIIEVYSGFAKDDDSIRLSSSGGMVTVISQVFVQNEGVVYGVGYSKDCRSIEYYRTTCLEELERFRGSKYAQARKKNIYHLLLADLKKGKKVLFIGLPCDVAAVYNFVKDNNTNLFTIELVCHGVTSPKVHEQFVDIEMDSNNERLELFSVRYKKDGWKPYYIYEKYKNGKEIIMPFRPTPYGIAFIYLKRPSCNFCKFKAHDDTFGLQADLTIGDNHGVKCDSPSYNKWGSSVAFVHTDKGKNLINLIKDSFVINRDTKELITNNLALYKPFPVKWNRTIFSKVFVNRGIWSASNLPSVQILDAKNRFIRKILVLLVNLRDKFRSFF